VLAQHGHVRRDDLPHELVVDTEVAVDEAIAHPGHAPPVDLIMPLAKVVGDPLGGLADDLKAPSERTPEVIVTPNPRMPSGRNR